MSGESKTESKSGPSRKPFAGGNWKCNLKRQSVEDLVKDLNKQSDIISPASVDVVVCPTFVHLDCALRSIDKKFQVGAQNCHVKGDGAFTGEISATMLVDLGVTWIILGHSERRAMGESNELVGEKVAIAINSGLSVIACVGETLEQRNNDQTLQIIQSQLQSIVEKVSNWSRVVIAYEPIWAIGTGVTATPKQAEEVHAAIRKYLGEKKGSGVADVCRIIYGGSVTAANCDSLIVQPNIDGFLVGGASLKAPDFITIIHALKRKC